MRKHETFLWTPEYRREYFRRWKAKKRLELLKVSVKKAKRKAYIANWRLANQDRVAKKSTEWSARHPWVAFESGLRGLSIHPWRSIFPAFVALDEHEGWRDNIPGNSPDPSQILMIKEEALAA